MPENAAHSADQATPADDRAASMPDWVDPRPWLPMARHATADDVERALCAVSPDENTLAALLSPVAAASFMEPMARKAQMLTREHFGRTIGLYVPLYLSDYCCNGCVYCGFAADRHQQRRCLTPEEIRAELAAIEREGFEEILLLTGERMPQADFAYLREAVAEAARRFHLVTVEVFPMSTDEYRQLAAAGCTGVSIYQETYDPARYLELHRWGPKRDYANRLATPGRALAGGLRSAGLGALLGLNDPQFEMLALYRHARHLQRTCWQAGVALAFPRIRPQAGNWQPPNPVSERALLQILLAFRIVCPDMPLTLSTRERPGFRDGVAGLAVNKMSIGSRTTVGGYAQNAVNEIGQFVISDDREIAAFLAALSGKGLQPVFKNSESVYRNAS